MRELVERAEETLRQIAAQKDNPLEPELPIVVEKSKKGKKRKRDEEPAMFELTKVRS